MTTDLPSLIERVEKATGPSAELDAAIQDALKDAGLLPFVAFWPNLTASLDSALALAERVLPPSEGWAWSVGDNPMIVPGLNAEAWVRCCDARRDNTLWQGRHHTPALALILALLRALQPKEPSND